MSKLGNVRIIDIPKFKAVSSGIDTFDNIFNVNGFWNWIETHRRLIKNLVYASPDFMWHEEGKSIWIWAIEDWVTEADTAPYKSIEFEGGIYVVATADENDSTDLDEVVNSMKKWIENSGVFEMDDRPGHRGMGHCIGYGSVNDAIGMSQQEIFLPVKLKNQ
jgi:hypothetical protein